MPGEVGFRSFFRLRIHLPDGRKTAIKLLAYDGQGFWIATN
jgi:hypothetical protein